MANVRHIVKEELIELSEYLTLERKTGSYKAKSNSGQRTVNSGFSLVYFGAIRKFSMESLHL